MDISFKFTENKIISVNMITGEPERADEIWVNINGQDFKEVILVSPRDKKCEDLDREKIRLFGMKLRELALNIERQAELGKPAKITVNKGTLNEKELVFF